MKTRTDQCEVFLRRVHEKVQHRRQERVRMGYTPRREDQIQEKLRTNEYDPFDQSGQRNLRLVDDVDVDSNSGQHDRVKIQPHDDRGPDTPRLPHVLHHEQILLRGVSRYLGRKLSHTDIRNLLDY